MVNLLAQQGRQLLFILDQVVYGLIPRVYELFFYLANINLANQDVVIQLINRIYLLLGIFMLFKVSFSILQYIVDPNAFSDKSKGFGKLVTNSLIAVVLLAMTPWIFSQAYELQKNIIFSNAIPSIILGDASYINESDTDVSYDKITKQREMVQIMGKDLQMAIFSAFYTLNVSDNDSGFETACKPIKDFPNSNIFGSKDMVNRPTDDDSSHTCLDAMLSEGGWVWNGLASGDTNLQAEMDRHNAEIGDFFKFCNNYDGDSKTCKDIIDNRDFSAYGKLLYWEKNGKGFTITYFPIISAIVGGYLLLLLITFCIDIAARVFKLLFLQAVAPVAIVSYIDPQESASNGKLHNWAIECGRTYVSLFLRLAVIYLAIYLVNLITSTVFVVSDYKASNGIYYAGLTPEEGSGMNIWIMLFLILGVFVFAKRLPLMIENIFNIKLSGELTLNPFKRFGEIASNPLVAAGIGALGGAAGAAAGNALAAGKKIRDWANDGGLDKTRQNLANARARFDYRKGKMEAASRYKRYFQEQVTKGVMTPEKAAELSQKAKNTAKRDIEAFRQAHSRVETGFRSNVSDIAGIAAGAVSGAVRGARGGATTKKGVESATKARQEATQARIDRDVRQKTGQTPGVQFTDALARFANIKNSEAGIGAADKQITQLTRAMENLREEETALRRSRAQSAVSGGADPRTLEMAIYRGTKNANGQFVRSLDSNGDPVPARTYNEYITEFNANPSAFGGGSPVSQDVFDSFRTASNAIESLDSQQAELRRTISDLTKLKNQGPGNSSK